LSNELEESYGLGKKILERLFIDELVQSWIFECSGKRKKVTPLTRISRLAIA